MKEWKRGREWEVSDEGGEGWGGGRDRRGGG